MSRRFNFLSHFDKRRGKATLINSFIERYSSLSNWSGNLKANSDWRIDAAYADAAAVAL